MSPSMLLSQLLPDVALAGHDPVLTGLVLDSRASVTGWLLPAGAKMSSPIDAILPFITVFAVANTALINMLMASRLVYGMSRQEVLPPGLGIVHKTRQTPWVAILFTTLISYGLISYVVLGSGSTVVSLLGGTTSLLLLANVVWLLNRYRFTFRAADAIVAFCYFSGHFLIVRSLYL